jgi:ATP-GRASP peptide maturase of grasp-with-spasm system
MIILLSQDRWEATTEDVQDWIEALGGNCLRFNGEDINSEESFTLTLTKDGFVLNLQLGERQIDPSEIQAVWTRRWHTYHNLSFLDEINEACARGEVRVHLMDEIRAVTGALDDIFRATPNLSLPYQRRVNKLVALRVAANAGLDVPATLVTTDRDRLREFLSSCGRIITKSLSESRSVPCGGADYLMYTQEVCLGDIEKAPARFFPSLFQELLVKRLEIRAFFLGGDLFGMAIFSQLDCQTALDFRRYNDRRPNRMVPYKIPDEVQRCVRSFMAAMDLETGSLDFVQTEDGRFVFLEVNPSGQFKMVSEPCNYHLEKLVAQYLIKLDRHGRL